MSTARTRLTLAVTSAAIAALALAGCSSSDPMTGGGGGESQSGDSSTIVVGSQAYYSNEIIAEIYAQSLENAGFDVERSFNTGERDFYLPSLEDGSIDLIPEYTGNLLQHYDPETTATTSDDVYAALQDALPEGLAVLEQSPATDQDSYNVTAAFAEENGLVTIGDLAGIPDLTLGGAPELEERPYGPSGLAEMYDVTVSFTATGTTTVDELVAGNIQLANVFSADPLIETLDLVTLEDPDGLFLASNVVPLVSADVADELADVLNPINAALTPEDLVALNVQSTVDQRSSADIATEWLTANNLD